MKQSLCRKISERPQAKNLCSEKEGVEGPGEEQQSKAEMLQLGE